jgi:hypothetical protein
MAKDIFSFLELVFEIIGGIRIAISPTLIGCGIGAFVYYDAPSPVRLTIGIGLSTVGLVIGILWAVRVYQTKGTMRFLATINEDNTKDTGSK